MVEPDSAAPRGGAEGGDVGTAVPGAGVYPVATNVHATGAPSERESERRRQQDNADGRKQVADRPLPPPGRRCCHGRGRGVDHVLLSPLPLLLILHEARTPDMQRAVRRQRKRRQPLVIRCWSQRGWPSLICCCRDQWGRPLPGRGDAVCTGELAPMEGLRDRCKRGCRRPGASCLPAPLTLRGRAVGGLTPPPGTAGGKGTAPPPPLLLAGWPEARGVPCRGAPGVAAVSGRGGACVVTICDRSGAWIRRLHATLFLRIAVPGAVGRARGRGAVRGRGRPPL